MDTYTITDSSCGSKSKWALVHLCTCKAAANRSNVYVSGKNYKILPIPETMQGISTSAKSKEEMRKKSNLRLTILKPAYLIFVWFSSDIWKYYFFSLCLIKRRKKKRDHFCQNCFLNIFKKCGKRFCFWQLFSFWK